MENTRKNELLSILSNRNGSFVSGEELARHFGCSRTAVWKYVAALRSEGYDVEAVTRQGYRLRSPEEDFAVAVATLLREKDARTPFRLHVKNKTDSTNKDARNAADNGFPEFSVFVAMRQDAGRGRRGRTFLSDNTDGLWFSVLLRPDLPLREASRVTLLFGLAVLRAIDRLCHIPVGLKWPNDIVSLQNGKKLCGILSETSMEESKISYAVIGCGINVSQTKFPEEISDKATSIVMSGVTTTREELLVAVLSETQRLYPAFLESPTGFLPEYRANCINLGRVCRVESAAPFFGIAEDISDTGDLLVRTDDGILHTCTSGEVSIRMP